ncbi:MAG: sphingosine kinase [Betaproteobacteria bacterium]|nr:sphingosine kinase [Betaproteobacteria bacterium]
MAANPIAVIVNASAGTGHDDHACDELEKRFAAHGIEARVYPARSGAELAGIAQRVAREKPAAVVAGGGDGTLNAVASALAGTGIPFGVLPLGTLNHFAKDLGIPLELDAAVQTIAQGHTADVDVGEVNGQVFINNSSLGLYPQIVRHRETQQRRLGRGKWPALLWASITALRRSPFMNVRLSLDNVEQRYKTTFVFIGNNEYAMEGFSIGKRERLDAGRLSVYVSHRRGRGGLVILALRALFGRLQQAKDFHALTAQSMVIETRRPRLHVATDGEVNMMESPLEYRVRPRALRVFVPQPAEAAP